MARDLSLRGGRDFGKDPDELDSLKGHADVVVHAAQVFIVASAEAARGDVDALEGACLVILDGDGGGIEREFGCLRLR